MRVVFSHVFWTVLGLILGVILDHFGRYIISKWCKNGIKSGSWSQGGPKWSFLTILDLILEHLGPHGGPKLSFWTILDLIWEHFGPHCGQVSNQYRLQQQKSKMLMAGQGTVAGRPTANGYIIIIIILLLYYFFIGIYHYY